MKKQLNDLQQQLSGSRTAGRRSVHCGWNIVTAGCKFPCLAGTVSKADREAAEGNRSPADELGRSSLSTEMPAGL